MTDPLSTVCDHCGAKLKLKNLDLEGKKIKCPKCGEAFVVAAAAPAPIKKPVKKKAADDDLDFMNVEADDYDSPVDEDEELDDDDAPRSSRRTVARGGKKKSKKKSKKGSGNSVQVIKIVALVLVALGVLGGGGFAMMTLLKGDGSSDVDWLPSDMEGFAKVQVDDIWAANVSQSLKNTTFVKKMVDDVTKNVGLGPQDIDRIVISFPANGKADDAVIVTHSKTPFDTAKIQAADKTLTEVSLNSTAYYKSNTAALLFPNSKTLVLGSESSIKSLIERGKKHPSAAKFAFANNYRDHLVIAASSPSGSVRRSVAYPGAEDVDAVLIRGNATSDVRLSVRGTFKTAEAAKASMEKTNAETAKAKKDLISNRAVIQNAPANPLIKKEQVLKMMDGAEQMINSLQIAQSGNHVNVSVTVSGQLISDFLEMAGSIPGSPLNRLAPFGQRQRPQAPPQPQPQPRSIGWE
jgi:predicted Zn finger-like uncharacterized protein